MKELSVTLYHLKNQNQLMNLILNRNQVSPKENWMKNKDSFDYVFAKFVADMEIYSEIYTFYS